MGYVTYFQLWMDGPEEAVEKAKKDILELDENLECLWEDGGEMKWYQWRDDMEKIAEKNPEVLFILDGDGEEPEDVWQWRAKGTITEYREVIFKLPSLKTKELFTESELLNQHV